MVLMMSGKVRVITKAKEIIEGDLMPHEDVEALKEHFPIFSMMGKKTFNNGLFIFTGHKISYVDRDEVKSITSLRFT